MVTKNQILEKISEYNEARTNSYQWYSKYINVNLNTTFDEDKTVYWNREEAERIRTDYRKKEAASNEKACKILEDLSFICSEYIIQEINVSKKQAAKIWNFLISKTSFIPWTQFNELEGILDLFRADN